MKVLRLQCRCGRNLVDVIPPGGRPGFDNNPSWTPDKLTVLARPGVRLQAYRPPPPASEGIGAPRTYTIDCPACSETWSLRHARVSSLWAEEKDRPGRVIRRTLG